MRVIKRVENGVVVEYTINGVNQLDGSKPPLIRALVPVRKPCGGCGKILTQQPAKTTLPSE